MCILIVMEPGKTVGEDELEISSLNNPDGFGWSIIDSNHLSIHTFRSMSYREAERTFYETRAAHPNTWAMFHARIATQGLITEYNCHPFPVGESELTVLAHNGMLDITQEHNDPKSDTHVFASEWLPTLGVDALDDPELFAHLERWARGSKIAVLSVDPTLEHWCYIVNERDGHWDDGVWYSNYSYQYVWGRKTYTPSLGSYSGTFERSAYKVLALSDIWPPDNGFRYDRDEIVDVYASGYEVVECVGCGGDTLDGIHEQCPHCTACVACGNWGVCRCEDLLPRKAYDPRTAEAWRLDDIDDDLYDFDEDGAFARWQHTFIAELEADDELISARVLELEAGQ